jgi:hypothetical protein
MKRHKPADEGSASMRPAKVRRSAAMLLFGIPVEVIVVIIG